MSPEDGQARGVRRGLAIALGTAAILLSLALISIPSAGASGNESYSGKTYTFAAGLPPEGITYLYQWTASDGHPLSSTERVFNWTAPVVYTVTPVVIDLIVRDKRGGCPSKKEFVVYVKPKEGTESYPGSNLSVIKKALPETAKPGQIVTYSYTVTNNGGLTISGITLADDRLGPVQINATSLEPGRSAAGEAKYTVAAKDIPGPISNLAVAEGRDSKGNTVKGSASASVLIYAIRESSIRISKGCIYRSPVIIGDQVTYTYNITNTGDLPLHDVNLSDVADWGPCCNPVYQGGDDGNGLLDPSETWMYTGLYTVQDPLDYEKLIIQSAKDNKGEIEALHERLERLKIMLQFRMQKMIRLQKSFDLSKAKLSTKKITINGTNYVMYNYTSRLTGAVLSRTIDSGGHLKISKLSDILSEVYLTTEYGDDGRIISHTLLANKTREYQRVEYDKPYIGYKTITTIDLKTGDTYIETIDANGIEVNKEFKKTPGIRISEEKIWLRNTATVTAVDSIGTTVSDFDLFILEIHRPMPVLSIEKAADPTPAVIGQILNYTITYRNEGDETARSVVVKETYDKNVTFVSAYPEPDSGTLDQWSIGDLDKGSSGVIRVVVSLPPDFNTTEYVGGIDPLRRVVRNVVNITCAQGVWKKIYLNTTAIVKQVPAIKLTKTRLIDNNLSRTAVRPGDSVVYSYRVNNTGNMSLKWLSLADDKLGEIPLDNTLLNGGEVALGKATYTVRESDLPGPLVNNASINGTPVTLFPGRYTNVTDRASVWIPISALNITKSPDKRSVRIRELINYTYRVRNSGSSTIVLKEITDVVKKNGRIIDVTPDPAGMVLQAGDVLWFNGTYNVTEDDLPDPVKNSPLINLATVRGRDPDGTEVNSSAEASVDILALKLTKTPDRKEIGSGDEVRYNYTVTNIGSEDVSLASLLDNKTADVDDPSGTWLQSGKSASFSGVYITNASDGDIVVNLARISGADDNGNVVNATASASVGIAMKLIKSANKSSAGAGDIIGYTYTVWNNGTSAITLSSLVDDLVQEITPSPAGLSIDPDQSAEFHGNYYVTTSDIGRPIINYATVSGTDENGIRITSQATASVNTSLIRLTKTPDKTTAYLGNNISYNFNIENYGTSDVTVESLEDVFNNGAVVNLTNIGIVIAGKSSISLNNLSITVNASFPYLLTNNATVHIIDEQGSEILANASASVNIIINGTIGMTKVPSKEVAKNGDKISYIYNITNYGPNEVKLKKLYDIIPKSGTIVADVDISNTTLKPYGSTSNYAIFKVYYKVNSKDGNPIINEVEVILDDDSIGAKDSATVKIRSAPQSSIEIEKMADRDIAKEGDVIHYTYRIKSKSNITLDELTDDYIRSLSPRPSGKTIKAGSPETFTGNYTVTSRDYLASNNSCHLFILNNVRAYGRDSGGNRVEGYSSRSVDLVPASLSLTKTPSKAVAKVGEEITYTYHLENRDSQGEPGGITLKRIELVDDKLGKIRTDKRELAPGENTTGTAKYTITRSDLPGPVRNNATVTSNIPLCSGGNASASVDLISLSINKTSSIELAAPGTTFHYYLTFRNSGNANATGVKVTDILDPVLEFDPIRGSIPAPTEFKETGNGTEYEWIFPLLRPGEEKVIEMVVTVKDDISVEKKVITNKYGIDCEPFNDKFPWNKPHTINLVNHNIWVNKKADKSSYSPGSEAVYTIDFGNSFDRTAYNVTIGDTLPDVEYLYSSASPTLMKGNLLLWSLGELPSNATGRITVTVRIPYRANMTYNESSYVSGTGYAYESKHMWTGMVPQSLLNLANITGYYVELTRGIKIWDGDNATVRSSVINPGTDVRVLEHGSGYLEQEEEVKVRIANRSIRLDRDTFAQHSDTNFTLPGGRVIPYRSKWSDWTRAKNDVRDESLSENYIHMDTIEKKSSLRVDENQTVYKSDADFDGGIAGIRFVKKQPGTKKSAFEVDDRYHGSFKIKESLDSYGSGVAYGKSAQGGGFVSSDKRPAGKTQRSYEGGSGSYQSEEIIHTGTTIKKLNMSYVPNIQDAGGRPVYYGSMPHEEMWTKDPDQGSSISESIAYASRIDKESLMEKTNLAIFGEFNGTAEIKAEKRKIPNPTQAAGGLKDRTAKGVEVVDQVLSGEYKIDTTISIRKLPKYIRPHITVTKRGKRISEDMVLFKINITNDGNKTLGPVEVVDILPEGMKFVNSSLRPKVNGSTIKWTILSLQRSKKQSIDLRVTINESDANTGFTNRARAVGTYDKVKSVEDEGSFFFILDGLPRFFASPEVRIEIENTSPEYLGGEGWGDGWKPPEEMGLCSNATYCPDVSNSDSECASCPTVVQLMEPNPNYK